MKNTKEIIILKLRMLLNNDLLEKNIISIDIYQKMQNQLIKKIDIIQKENNNIWIS